MEFLYEMLAKTVDVDFGNFTLPIPYVEVGAIIILLFLLVLSMAHFRRHYVDWSFKGAMFGILFGFLLAITLETFLLVKGNTVVTQLMGWKNAPKPITRALDAGREKLVGVLGATDQISSTLSSVDPTSDQAIQVLQSLDPQEVKKVKNLICEP